jgi:transposase
MSNYKIIGIDLAKTKFHLAAIDKDHKVVFKKAITRTEFFSHIQILFPNKETFAFEACGGCHYVAQMLKDLGHETIVLKPKDVKPYAKSRQKNDINDAIAICKAACDPELKHVLPKTKSQQEICYLHKVRENVIQQRIQISNSLITSLQEFGYIVTCGKAKFAKDVKSYIDVALEEKYIDQEVYEQMLIDKGTIDQLMEREKLLDKKLIAKNKVSENAKLLETIPGIGPINASILSTKSMEAYESSKDFAASLGLVPRQHTTGGTIQLGGITKQGDRYARKMLIQGARTIVMRICKENRPIGEVYQFAETLKKSGKCFNVVCVAVANKLARIAYACVMKQNVYNAFKHERISVKDACRNVENA